MHVFTDYHDRYDAYTRNLSRYLNQISSRSLDWLTKLALHDVYLAQSDLMAIATVPNLAAIYVGCSDPVHSACDDRIIRAWARQSTENGAFLHLKSLCLVSQSRITKASLDTLACISSLEDVRLYMCGVPYHPDDLHWERVSR